jgi:alpha-ribazole phosphatase
VQLYLIRHPAPQVAVGVCYGRTDLPLAEDVAAAATRIAAQLPPRLAIYTSPLQRCQQLADALDPVPNSDSRLQEMNFGEWEMRPWNLIEREALDHWAADPLGYAPPQGESVGELKRRVLHFLCEAQGRKLKSAALVTHAGVMKVIVGHVQEMLPRQWMALKFDYERVICVDVESL